MLTSCRLWTLAAAVLCTAGRTASAQVCNTAATDVFLSYTVAPSAVALTAPGTIDFNAGFSQPSGVVTVTIFPTFPQWATPWYLCINATSANMGTVNGYTKSIADLQFSIDGVTWTTMSAALKQVATGSGWATISLQLRSKISYALDQPNVGGAPFTYAANLSLQVAH
jgi:hypothetical protein